MNINRNRDGTFAPKPMSTPPLPDRQPGIVINPILQPSSPTVLSQQPAINQTPVQILS